METKRVTQADLDAADQEIKSATKALQKAQVDVQMSEEKLHRAMRNRSEIYAAIKYNDGILK